MDFHVGVKITRPILRPGSGAFVPARGNECGGAGDLHVAQATLLRSQLENATHSQRFMTFARQHR